MACPACGANATGQFCRECGNAIPQASSPDVTDAAEQSVGETSVRPPNPGDPKWVINKLRGVKRGPAIGLAVAAAVVVVAVVAATLASSGSSTGNTAAASGTTAVHAATTPTTASVSTTAPTLKTALADPKTCIQTLNSLADQVGPPNQGGPGSALLTPDQIDAVTALLGPEPSVWLGSELWTAAYLGSQQIKYNDPANVQCGSGPPYDVGLVTRAAQPHESITRQLPPLPVYWADGTSMDPYFVTCFQSMLDAVPRIAAGHDAAVRADYASTPNLLASLELEASNVPKGSVAEALAWMNAPTNGAKEGVGQMCSGWAQPTQIINGTPATTDAPSPTSDTPTAAVDYHFGGSERVTRQLPPLPQYWTATIGTTSPIMTSCVQAMLDAVPRIAAGQDATVRTDYASTPNLLYWLEQTAQRAPKGSIAGALAWMNQPVAAGAPGDGERESVDQSCIGWTTAP
jgi:hypothetical protein